MWVLAAHLMITIADLKALQSLGTSLFSLCCLLCFLAPGKTSTLVGKVIGGGGPERGSVSVSSQAQISSSAVSPLGQGAHPGDQRLFSSNASAANPLFICCLDGLSQV